LSGRRSKVKARANVFPGQLHEGRSPAEAARRVGLSKETPRMARRRDPAAERRASFLSVLAACPSVAEACRRAGLPSRTAYGARQRDPRFAEDWDAAVAQSVAARRAAFLACLRDGGTRQAAYRQSGLSESAVRRARRREPGFARALDEAAAAGEQALERRAERQLEERHGQAAGGSSLDRVNGYPPRALMSLLMQHRPLRFKDQPSRADLIREGARLLAEQLRQPGPEAGDEG